MNPWSDSLCEPEPSVACPEPVGKGGVEEVSVVANLVGRNVVVESYKFSLDSMFLCKSAMRSTPLGNGPDQSREDRIPWSAEQRLGSQ